VSNKKRIWQQLQQQQNQTVKAAKKVLLKVQPIYEELLAEDNIV
jgi:hypothetical protein